MHTVDLLLSVVQIVNMRHHVISSKLFSAECVAYSY